MQSMKLKKQGREGNKPSHTHQADQSSVVPLQMKRSQMGDGAFSKAVFNSHSQQSSEPHDQVSHTIQRRIANALDTSESVQRQEININNTGLPDQVKTGIENLSGVAMDDVKVHYNSSKPAQLQAHAYTQGTDIHVGPGQEKHIAHEAWHVVQQKQGRVKPTMQMAGQPVNDQQHLEHEADVMGARAMRSHSNPSQLKQQASSSCEGPVQRVAVIQMLSGAWGDYYKILAKYSSDAASTWGPRLQAAEKAKVLPPRLTEHASKSGSGDQGNKAQQMTDKLKLWWSINKSKIQSSGSKDSESISISSNNYNVSDEEIKKHQLAKKLHKASRKKEKFAKYQSSLAYETKESTSAYDDPETSPASKYLIELGLLQRQYPPQLREGTKEYIRYMYLLEKYGKGTK